MFYIRIISRIGVLMLLLATFACTSSQPAEPAAVGEPAEVNFEDFEDFDPSSFDESAKIDNNWLPLRVGNQWIFEGSTDEDGERVQHRIEFTVTDLVKEVFGVQTAVAFIEDYSDDELVESEIAFYAQDNKGNVWYLGEYPEEYEEGEFVEAPAWIGGQEGALPGVKMWAQPRMGTDSYAQGWAPEVEWSDRGLVYKMNQQICAPAYCGGDVLVIDEFSQGEPNAFQEKYYAPGIGNVAVGWRGEDASQEELELTDFVQLDQSGLDEVRELALALEDHAYEISEVYSTTDPVIIPELPPDPNDAVVDDQVLQGFNPNNFDNPTIIDNQWLSMPPGRQLTFEGVTEEPDGTTIPHRIVWTVTDLVKEVNGVQTVVAWIQDFAGAGDLVESEIAFYAQDNEGNVWYFGEYPEEWEGGNFIQASPWIAGMENALAGIKMLADPQVDTPSYAQGWGPAVGWSDRAQVHEVNQETCVAYDCFEDVVIIGEFSEDEPGAVQLKSYAPGIGNVEVGWTGDDPNKETLELVDYQDLDTEALAAINEGALALEDRAFKISSVYSHTEPAQIMN